MLNTTLGAVSSRPSGFALVLIIISFAVKLFSSFASMASFAVKLYEPRHFIASAKPSSLTTV